MGLGQQPDGQTPPRSEGVHHTDNKHTHYLGTARLLGISGELGRVSECVCVCVCARSLARSLARVQSAVCCERGLYS